MERWLAVTRVIDGINRRVAIVAVYLTLFAALLSAFNAIIRYGIGTMVWLDRNYGAGGLFSGLLSFYGRHSNSFLEGQWYMFAGMVMLGAPWTLKINEHVRVDLIYGSVSERTRLWIDIFGGVLFLLPMCFILFYFTWPWFLQSWNIHEVSPNAGGLVRWPVKLLLPVGFGLMILQGISEIIKRVAALFDVIDDAFVYEKPLQ